MARYRKIRNYGSAGWSINLLQSDIEDLNIKDGDWVDIEEAIKKTSISDEMFQKLKIEERKK